MKAISVLVEFMHIRASAGNQPSWHGQPENRAKSPAIQRWSLDAQDVRLRIIDGQSTMGGRVRDFAQQPAVPSPKNLAVTLALCK